MSGKILITGATGNIGGEIVRLLAATVKDVTGNDAISFEQFVQDNKEAWL